MTEPTQAPADAMTTPDADPPEVARLAAKIVELEKTVAYLLRHSHYNDERRAGYSHAEASYRTRIMFRLDDDVEV